APTVARRNAPCPANCTMLTDGPRPRRCSRYSPNVSHEIGMLPESPLVHSRIAAARPGAIGAGEKLHMPTTSVVTPWRTLDSADGQPSYTRSECEWMSMKPGATIRPRASMVRAASPERLGPTATMRSFSMATSATTAGAPLPSTTVPFLISSDHAMTVGPPGIETLTYDDTSRF